MAIRTTHHDALSPFDTNLADWADQQIEDHPLADLGWEPERIVQTGPGADSYVYRPLQHRPHQRTGEETKWTNRALWSLRCGAYRVIFDIQIGNMEIVGHRREAYDMVGH